MPRHHPTPEYNRSAGSEDPRGQWLTRVAFVLSFAIVIARVTILETLRDPFSVNLGSLSYPRGAGAATGMVLDALCWLPAIMVFVRRLVDPGYRLHLSWSQLFLTLLAIWGMTCPFWSADKFAAVAGSFHFLSAVVLFFAAAQLVRTWSRLRLVAAVSFGLLMVFVAQGLYYRLVDLPDLQRSFAKNKIEMLHDRGWEPGSFAAAQFSRKIENGEMIGFNASPNTFAAIIVLVSIITFGVLAQRLADRDGFGWTIPYSLGIGLGAVIIWYTHGKAAMATLVLGMLAMAILWIVPGLRRWLGRHATCGYIIAVAAVLIVGSAIIAHGIYHGGLPTDSLNFRWRYWVGSAHLFLQHPLFGVGWDNFGSYYLGTRLQSAAEEIKDPHDFILKFVLELGVIGGLLALIWVCWMAWDLTRPLLPAADDSPLRTGMDPARHASPIGRIALIGLLAILINILASLDLDEQTAYVIVELFKRGLYFCVLVIGGALVALRHIEQSETDGRFAGWIFHALLVALGLFLVQSTIDVAFFETGPMFLFFILAGSALGMRLSEPTRHHPSKRSSLPVAGALTGLTLCWIAAMVLIVGPVVSGEMLANSGDDQMRARHADRALVEYSQAADAVPWNADYAYRAAKAALSAGDPNAQAERYLDQAIRKNPMLIDAYLTRIDLELQRRPIDTSAVRRDYQKVVKLNPNDLGLRIAYADLLTQLGDTTAAQAQYRIALKKDDQYDRTEPKRLSAAERSRIEKAIQGS